MGGDHCSPLQPERAWQRGRTLAIQPRFAGQKLSCKATDDSPARRSKHRVSALGDSWRSSASSLMRALRSASSRISARCIAQLFVRSFGKLVVQLDNLVLTHD